MAAERHQARDDRGLAEADVAHDRHAAVGAGIGAVEVGIDLLEEPLAAREDGVHGDAGHLKQQRFEGDVLRPVGGKTHWWVRKSENQLVVLQLEAIFIHIYYIRVCPFLGVMHLEAEIV